jgi:regulator of protease activity HflC (stomatin/prohibitin superfamily)
LIKDAWVAKLFVLVKTTFIPAFFSSNLILTGLHFELPCVEHCDVVDMRTHVMSVPPQEVDKKYAPT